MSFLTADQANNTQPNYVGVPIQTAVTILPIPVGWGVFLLAPNLVQYFNFQGKNVSPPGKGFGGTQLKDYTASIVFALCEGPIYDVPEVILSTQVFWLTTRHFTIFLGTTPQAPWSTAEAQNPAIARGYNGTALLAAANYDMGQTPELPNHNCLVYGPLVGTAWWCQDVIPGTAFDSPTPGPPPADLACIIWDFLQNPKYGVPGFPAAAIDVSEPGGVGSLFSPSFVLEAPTAYGTAQAGYFTATSGTGSSGDPFIVTDGSLQTYLVALGMGYCPLCDSVETAQSILDRWLQIAFCAAVWSGTRLKFIPYADQPISNTYELNGLYYTFEYVPNLTPVYDLDDDDFVGDASADPVIWTRSDPADAKNVLRLEVMTNDGYWSYVPVEARDQNAIETNGLRVAPTVTAHEIVSTGLGGVIAQLLLQRGLYIRNTVQFKLSWEFCLLEPMDLVTIPDQVTGVPTVVRVTQIEEDDQGELTVTAEEFPQGIATQTRYQRGSSTFTIPDPGVDPDPVNPPVIFEPTAAMIAAGLAPGPAVWIAASGGSGGVADPYWGGAQVWIAAGATGTYEEIGEIVAPARQGLLTASILAGDTTASVDLTMSGGALIGGSAADAAAGRTLCWLDGELVAYETATLSLATVSGEAQTVPVAAPYVLEAAEGSAWSSDGGVAYALGGSLTAAAPATVTGEAQTVPEGVPFVVDAANIATWIADGGVSYAAGGALTLVAGDPAVGQYAVNEGQYQLSQADAGAAIDLAYTWADPGTGQYTVAAGTYWFNAADAGKGVKLTYGYANPCHYALGGLVRGMFGTAAASHASGAPFARLDSAVFQYPLQPPYVGQTLYIKLLSFNIWGNSVEDASTVTPITYVPTGTGVPPGPIASRLAEGVNVDFGHVSSPVTVSDDFGVVAGAAIQIVADLGIVTAT